MLNECLNSLDHARRSKAAPRDLGNRLLSISKGVNGTISERPGFQQVERLARRNGGSYFARMYRTRAIPNAKENHMQMKRGEWVSGLGDDATLRHSHCQVKSLFGSVRDGPGQERKDCEIR